MSLTLWIVRHGETQLNDQNRIRGWLDVPLDEKGIKEAHQDANFFSDMAIARIYCSDLERTKMTAKVIAEPFDLSPVPTVMLRPINFGALNGAEVDKAKAQMDAWFKRWSNDPDAEIPNGESWNSFQNRNLSAMKMIVRDASDGDQIIVVTHLRNCILFRAWMLNNSKPLAGKAIELMNRPDLQQRTDEITKYNLDTKTSIFSLEKLFKIVSKVGDYFPVQKSALSGS